MMLMQHTHFTFVSTKRNVIFLFYFLPSFKQVIKIFQRLFKPYYFLIFVCRYTLFKMLWEYIASCLYMRNYSSCGR